MIEVYCKLQKYLGHERRFKMKAYTIALYTTEVTEKELKDRLNGKGLDEYTNILMGLCLEDTSPSYSEGGDYGIYYTNETAAWGAKNHTGEIIHYPGNHLYHVSGVAIEHCEINEDGEFIEGSDYDWDKGLYHSEDLQKLHDDLFGED